jgi:trans-aconitate methyltransferase
MKPSASIIAFDQNASAYDVLRKALIPCYEGFYGNVIDLMAYEGSTTAPRVLDLGAGTGLLSSHIKRQWPGAFIHLIDGSEAMLAQARQRFAGEAAISFEIGDLNDVKLNGPFDFVVSALAIHHLSDSGKRTLFKKIHSCLRSGGLFINAEQVASPTVGRAARYADIWNAEAKARGASEQDLEAAAKRMAHDQCASVEDQLLWLREAGFSDADCTFKSWRFAVLSGTKITAS